MTAGPSRRKLPCRKHPAPPAAADPILAAAQCRCPPRTARRRLAHPQARARAKALRSLDAQRADHAHTWKVAPTRRINLLLILVKKWLPVNFKQRWPPSNNK